MNFFSEANNFASALKEARQQNADLSIEANPGLGIIVQARMGSTRLPGKVSRLVGDKEYLLHQIERILVKCPANRCVVATTNLAEDDVVCEMASKAGVLFFRGSSRDVLKRYIDAAKKNQFTDVVRLTGDCPLIDPFIIDGVIRIYNSIKSHSKYVSNTLVRTFPRGFDVEITTLNDLQRAWIISRREYDREHVTPYIKSGLIGGCVMVNCSAKINQSKWRFTLDTIEDHYQLSRVLLGVKGYSIDQVLTFSANNNLLLLDS